MNTYETRLNWAMGRCLQAGLRLTHSRRVLLAALSMQTAPITIDRLHELSGGVCDFATVFRAIRLFERAGIVRHVGLDPRISNYVLLAPGEHLDLLVCRDCGSVSEVEDAAAVRELEQRIAARSGFSVLYHELEFYGTCPGCQRSKSAPPELHSSQSA